MIRGHKMIEDVNETKSCNIIPRDNDVIFALNHQIDSQVGNRNLKKLIENEKKIIDTCRFGLERQCIAERIFRKLKKTYPCIRFISFDSTTLCWYRESDDKAIFQILSLISDGDITDGRNEKNERSEKNLAPRDETVMGVRSENSSPHCDMDDKNLTPWDELFVRRKNELENRREVSVRMQNLSTVNYKEFEMKREESFADKIIEKSSSLYRTFSKTVIETFGSSSGEFESDDEHTIQGKSTSGSHSSDEGGCSLKYFNSYEEQFKPRRNYFYNCFLCHVADEVESISNKEIEEVRIRKVRKDDEPDALDCSMPYTLRPKFSGRTGTPQKNRLETPKKNRSGTSQKNGRFRRDSHPRRRICCDPNYENSLFKRYDAIKGSPARMRTPMNPSPARIRIAREHGYETDLFESMLQ